MSHAALTLSLSVSHCDPSQCRNTRPIKPTRIKQQSSSVSGRAMENSGQTQSSHLGGSQTVGNNHGSAADNHGQTGLLVQAPPPSHDAIRGTSASRTDHASDLLAGLGDLADLSSGSDAYAAEPAVAPGQARMEPFKSWRDAWRRSTTAKRLRTTSGPSPRRRSLHGGVPEVHAGYV